MFPPSLRYYCVGKEGVKSGGPKCHGPIVEVGSHIIVIVIIVVIVIFTSDTGKSKL